MSDIELPEPEKILADLYAGETTPDQMDADIRYFEKKIERWKERYEGHTDGEEFKRLVMKTESQLRLLKETRDIFFARRAEIMEDQDDAKESE